jgi:hypothetical protein
MVWLGKGGSHLYTTDNVRRQHGAGAAKVMQCSLHCVFPTRSYPPTTTAVAICWFVSVPPWLL